MGKKRFFFFNRLNRTSSFLFFFFILKWEQTSLWIFCYSQNWLLTRILYGRILLCHQSGRFGLVLFKLHVHTVHNVICSRWKIKIKNIHQKGKKRTIESGNNAVKRFDLCLLHLLHYSSFFTSSFHVMELLLQKIGITLRWI